MAVNINIDSQVSQTITDGVTDKAPSENAVFDALALKVDKVTGKQLSTEDYTTTEKSKLAGIEAGAEVNVNADWNATSGDAQILNKPTISSSITIGTTPITSGVAGRVLFEGAGNVVQEDAGLFWDNVNKRLGVGATPNTSTRLDVRAQGALSTDVAFRVRNSADSANIASIAGNGSFVFGANYLNWVSNISGTAELTGITSARLVGGGTTHDTSLLISSTDIWLRHVIVKHQIGGSSILWKSTYNGNNSVFELIESTKQSNILVIGNGTGIISNPTYANAFQQYSADITAGNAAPHFRTENGSIIKLYKQDLPTSPTNAELATFLSNLGLANLI
jgi:hypothetical protein